MDQACFTLHHINKHTKQDIELWGQSSKCQEVLIHNFRIFSTTWFTSTLHGIHFLSVSNVEICLNQTCQYYSCSSKYNISYIIPGETKWIDCVQVSVVKIIRIFCV